MATTAPFTLGPKDGPPCLLIHGFTGSAWEMLPLGEFLAQNGFFVRGILLPGHGGEPKAMLHATADDWRRASEAALLSFGDKKVRLAGLSMGALLSVWLAARFPERVAALALLAPAVQFRDRQMAAARWTRSLGLLSRVKPWVPKESTDIEDPVARAQSPSPKAFPTKSLGDLWEVQDLARASWPKVKAPALVGVARNDHVVTEKGAQELVRGMTNSKVEYLELEKGAHIIPRDFGAAEAAEAVGRFFRENKGDRLL